MTTTAVTSGIGLDVVAELAARLRVDSVRSSTGAGSGRPASSRPAAGLLAVLGTRHRRCDGDDPRSPARGQLIFSMGRAWPLLYSVCKAVGVAGEQELMTGYRRFGQRLRGHPAPVLPWAGAATGSPGQGLPGGGGVALAGRCLDRLRCRVWVLCGDGELAGGSIWEALDKAFHCQLSSLVVIVEVSRLGPGGPAGLGWILDACVRRAGASGARTLAIDGHGLDAIDALAAAGARSQRRAVHAPRISRNWRTGR